MNISTKGRYAVRALIELAGQQSNQPVMLSTIAQSQEIPERYLIQIFGSLRQAGLVKSFRGAKGGFLLNRHPASITLEDILTATEGPIALVKCRSGEYEQCQRRHHCAAQDIWEQLAQDIRQLFRGVTLEGMLAREREHQGLAGGMYQI